MELDRDTILAVSSLISLVLGAILLAAQVNGRLGSWATCWGAGTVMLGLAGADQALKGMLPAPLLVGGGNMLGIGGYVLVAQGARLLADRPPHWRAVAMLLAVAWLPLVLSTSPEMKAARVAYNNAVIILCDLWVAIEAVRLARREGLGTAWITVGLFAVTIPFSAMRLGVALETLMGTNTLANARVGTWLAALLAVFWSLRGALPALLIAERHGRKLARLACHDALTGALNRVGLAQARERLAGPAALVMFDMDHFKALNDRYGHARGDAVLQLFAETVRACLPRRAAFVRLGGDEFALILPGTTAEAARRIAEAVRGGFTAALGPLDLAAPRPTLSVGISAGDLGREEPDALLAEADAALYAAKRAGRDCVSVRAAA